MVEIGCTGEYERELLQNRAASEHVVKVPVADAGREHAEFMEAGQDVGSAGETSGVREREETQEEALERGAAEDVPGEAHGVGGEPGEVGVVDEDKVLDAIGSEEARPLCDLALVGREPAAGDVDGAEGARVVGKDAGDDGSGQVGVVEGERGGAPEVAPTGDRKSVV